MDTKLNKHYSRDEIKLLCGRLFKTHLETDQMLDDLSVIYASFISGDMDEKKRIEPKLNKLLDKYMMTTGQSNHYPVTELVFERRRPLIISMTKDLIAEYNCKTPSEISLAETIASSFVRALEYGSELKGCLKIDHPNNELNGYYALLSKEMDRAYRHYFSALALLRQIKNPSIEINIQTKNAFVANNQQNNANTIINDHQ